MTEQSPLWGLPERPDVPLRKGGSVLVIRLSPELHEALRKHSDGPMVDHLVQRILNDWAGISEVSTTTDEAGTFSEPSKAAAEVESGHD